MEIKFYIEPEEVPQNEEELINEVITWAERENKELEVLQIRDNLIFKIDGTKYYAKLEPPKRLLTKSGIPLGGGMLGYKCIYFYEF